MEPGSTTPATGTLDSVVTPTTSTVTLSRRTVVTATHLQAMINNAIATSLNVMSSSIEKMVQDAVSKSTVPRPSASTPITGGGLTSDMGVICNSYYMGSSATRQILAQ